MITLDDLLARMAALPADLWDAAFWEIGEALRPWVEWASDCNCTRLYLPDREMLMGFPVRWTDGGEIRLRVMVEFT